MDSRQLKQKLSKMRAQLAAKEKKLELENRLSELKKEMAAKQKKLQKAERVAKVKSHVKNKLCELRASENKSQDQSITVSVPGSTQDCNRDLSGMESSRYSSSNTLCILDNDIAIVKQKDAAKPSLMESQTDNYVTPLLNYKEFSLENTPKVSSLIEPSSCSMSGKTNSELCKNDDQYTPIKRRISKSGKSLSLQQVRLSVKPENITSCSENTQSVLSSPPAEKDSLCVYSSEFNGKGREFVSKENGTNIPRNTLVKPECMLTLDGSSKQFGLEQSDIPAVNSKNPTDLGVTESKTPSLNEQNRKRHCRQKRSDWTAVVPRRKSPRVLSSQTSLSLKGSFLQTFSQDSQECTNGFENSPRCLPRWQEGLSQLSQIPKLSKTRRSWMYFPPLPKLVVEQHCFDANFVEFSLPSEIFGDIHGNNLRESGKTESNCEEKKLPSGQMEQHGLNANFVELSLPSESFGNNHSNNLREAGDLEKNRERKKLVSEQILQFPPVPTHLTQKLLLGDGYVEFSLQDKEFKCLMSQKSSCSLTQEPTPQRFPCCGESPQETIGSELLASPLSPTSAFANEAGEETVSHSLQINHSPTYLAVQPSERNVQTKYKEVESNLESSHVVVQKHRQKELTKKPDESVTTQAKLVHANIELGAVKSEETLKSLDDSIIYNLESNHKSKTLQTNSEACSVKPCKGDVSADILQRQASVNNDVHMPVSKMESFNNMPDIEGQAVVEKCSINTVPLKIKEATISKAEKSVNQPTGENPITDKDVTEESLITLPQEALVYDDNKQVQSNSDLNISTTCSNSCNFNNLQTGSLKLDETMEVLEVSRHTKISSCDHKLSSDLNKRLCHTWSPITTEVPCESTSDNVESNAVFNTSSQPTVIGETQDLSELLSPNSQCHQETVGCFTEEDNVTVVDTCMTDNLDGNPVSPQSSEYCDNEWLMTDSLKVGRNKVELILTGTVSTQGKLADYVVVTTAPTLSVWKACEKTWSEVHTITLLQDYSAVRGFTFAHPSCIQFVLLWSDEKKEFEEGNVYRLTLDGSDVQTWSLSSLMISHVSRWIGCALPDGWAVFGQFHIDTKSSKLWRCQFEDSVTSLPLESVPGNVMSLCPLEGRDDALLGYGSPSQIHIWNHYEGVLLTSVQLTMTFSELKTAQEHKGLLYVVLMIDDLTTLGCVVVVNPNTQISKICHCLMCSSEKFSLKERYSAIQDGLLVCWDKKQVLRMNIYSGECIDWAHLPTNNGSCTTFSSHRLFTSTESGLVNIYSNQ